MSKLVAARWFYCPWVWFLPGSPELGEFFVCNSRRKILIFGGVLLEAPFNSLALANRRCIPFMKIVDSPRAYRRALAVEWLHSCARSDLLPCTTPLHWLFWVEEGSIERHLVCSPHSLGQQNCQHLAPPPQREHCLRYLLNFHFRFGGMSPCTPLGRLQLTLKKYSLFCHLLSLLFQRNWSFVR